MVHPYTVFKGGIKTIFNVCLYFRTALHSTISTCGFCKDKHPVMGSKCDERMIMMMTFKQYWVTNGLTGVSTPQESRMIAIHVVLNYKFLDTDVSTQLARWYLFHHFCFRTPKLSQIASSWNYLIMAQHLFPLFHANERRQEYSFTMPESALTNIFKARGHRFCPKVCPARYGVSWFIGCQRWCLCQCLWLFGRKMS